jgi:hypothetical protein
MSSSVAVRDISKALSARLLPTVTTWNRLEARPRTIAFDRALRAEVRDALWMLTKQWQMGEFKGSDAGSPVSAKTQVALTRLTKYQPGKNPVEPIDYATPLDVAIERRGIPLTIAGRVMSLDIRVAIGRYWLALIDGIGSYLQAFIDAYPIVKPDPMRTDNADVCAHADVWQSFAALATRAMDGGALIDHLRANAANHAYDGVVGVASTDFDAIDKRAARLIAWYERAFAQPTPDNDAWIPDQLEYQFAVSAPAQGGGETVYVADEFYQSSVDWYVVDADGSGKGLAPISGSDSTDLPPNSIGTTIPIPVSFSGMPNTRWWTFEERKTNFGDIDAATTDLAKLLFIEFALVYSNDWFVIPYTLPSGSVARLRALVVTNTFGERFSIDPAGSGADDDWQRWTLFTIDTRGQPKAPADSSLLLLPATSLRQESAPTESLALVRDEVANMVWGVETSVPLANGDAKRGLEAARQTRAYLEALFDASGTTPPPAAPPAAPVAYKVMSTVPENWVPFIPVHIENDNREIQLQRAAMPRLFEGDPNPPAKVQPRTVLLRTGLDASPPSTYFVHEEEVPRAGVQLTQNFERSRWTDGRVFVWLRARKQCGRGEGASGLMFDSLVDQKSS